MLRSCKQVLGSQELRELSHGELWPRAIPNASRSRSGWPRTPICQRLEGADASRKQRRKHSRGCSAASEINVDRCRLMRDPAPTQCRIVCGADDRLFPALQLACCSLTLQVPKLAENANLQSKTQIFNNDAPLKFFARWHFPRFKLVQLKRGKKESARPPRSASTPPDGMCYM